MKTKSKFAYIFSYNLFQFCGHTWILANTIARFLTFGQDALADTFYSVGFVMSLCQLLSILELFHIADGIEKARLLPRFVQVMEKNLLLVMVILLEEFQSKPVVCIQFFLWNILDLLRCALIFSFLFIYSFHAFCDKRQLQVIAAPAERVTVYQALPYIEQVVSHSAPLRLTVTTHLHLPLILMVYLPVHGLGKNIKEQLRWGRVDSGICYTLIKSGMSNRM
uniref:Very-long-chain (3R)-3-hydroxyacyl-CoA dehydratase n=1 Tax=Monopterus albus TaxID=43700 RepID=A0A3Q3K607_MONAL